MQSCENVDQLNGRVIDYINICVGTKQKRKKYYTTCFDFTDWSVVVQSCENVDQLNGRVIDYINICVGIKQKRKKYYTT